MHVGLWKTEREITTFLRLADADNSVSVVCVVRSKAFILSQVLIKIQENTQVSRAYIKVPDT